ncbi:hypothetical protein FE257_000415 [Aspergillus nanangensis]|uniref:Uncharacterized protein n=1 Tax=Aspergillus nanangensis TaxID=2582783 RepID=A0AAD4GXF2_ASPNN|nr:hypothetical protein FE257_000415 [Aspergillus nanangensis]
MPRLSIRNTCPITGTQWYVCSLGDYRGCCSVDPCIAGGCPDDAGKPMSSQTWVSTSTSTTSTSTSTSTVTTSTQATSTSTTILPTNPATSSPTAGPVNTESHHNNGALIGAVVGGVAGLVLLLGLVFFLMRRSRRKDRGSIKMAYPLVLLVGPKRNREKSRRPAVATDKRTLDKGRGTPKHTNGKPTTRTNGGPSRSAVRPPPTKVSSCASSSPRASPRTSPSKPSRSSPTKPLPNKASPTKSPLTRPSPTRQSPSKSSPTKRSPGAASTRALTQSMASSSSSASATISSLSLSEAALSLKHLPPIPQQPKSPSIPPELPDTGFYRQRAELAAQSSRELINTFNPRRQLHRSLDLGDAEGTCPRMGPIITEDGVVLTANFDRSSSCGDELLGLSCDSGTGSGHVMRFMDYDPEWDAILPAYQPSWRSRMEDCDAGDHPVEKSELGRIEESESAR